MSKRVIGWVETGEERPPKQGEHFATGPFSTDKAPFDFELESRRIMRPLTEDDVIVPRSEVEALREALEAEREKYGDEQLQPGNAIDAAWLVTRRATDAVTARLPKREPTAAEHVQKLREVMKCVGDTADIRSAMEAAIAALEAKP